MATKIFSCSFIGLECQIIEVQADISSGLPHFSIVGLGDASVQESKERVRASIKNSGADYPVTRKTVNLAPAEVRKQGSLFDLPIAVSLLVASGQMDIDFFRKSILIGELSLNGQVKKINGILPITQFAKEQGFKRIFLPKANALEASFIEDIDICPLQSLKELIAVSKGGEQLTIQKHIDLKSVNHTFSIPTKEKVFAKILGLEQTKRALMVAAAGGHNVMLEGSPGCGKTVISRAFQDILPQMSKKEILETTKIFSIAGLLDPEIPIILERPFREVHHTATTPAIVGGGGRNAKPGEISLAHNGVLFLDEIAEFPRQSLEALRQPLEDKYICINRTYFSLKFPSNFILIATMNPCPCGFFADKKVPCKCSDSQISRYQKKISGPLLDRFDLFIKPSKFALKNMFHDNSEEIAKQEKEINKMIKNARKVQTRRFKNHSQIMQNSDMTLDEIKKHARLKKSVHTLLSQASEKLNLSNRGYLKTIKVARTIADLEQKLHIEENHIAEALQYRKKSRY